MKTMNLSKGAIQRADSIARKVQSKLIVSGKCVRLPRKIKKYMGKMNYLLYKSMAKSIVNMFPNSGSHLTTEILQRYKLS